MRAGARRACTLHHWRRHRLPLPCSMVESALTLLRKSPPTLHALWHLISHHRLSASTSLALMLAPTMVQWNPIARALNRTAVLLPRGQRTCLCATVMMWQSCAPRR